MGNRSGIPRLVAALLIAAPVIAHAQGTGRSLDIDPSVRAAGMGLASNAVFWGEATDNWANPAQLGNQHGLSYEWGRTRLAPGALSSDIHFTSNVVKIGGAGLGVALSGKPGIGGLHLSYGESEGVDSQGNFTGTFASFEQVDAWGFGLSLARRIEAAALLMGRKPPPISRYGDFSFGMTSKKLELDLAPGYAGGGATTNASDYGFLFRVSPIELIPEVRDVLGIDLGYGQSDLSYRSDPVIFVNEPQPSQVSEHERHGFAGRARLDWAALLDHLAGPKWIWDGFHPLLSAGYARDHARIGVPGARYETDGRGWEFTLANLFTLRKGHYEDRTGGIDGDTHGWGVGIPIGTLAGLRYDHASFPQANGTGLPDVERDAASGWVDVLRVYRYFRGDTAGD